MFIMLQNAIWIVGMVHIVRFGTFDGRTVIKRMAKVDESSAW